MVVSWPERGGGGGGGQYMTKRGGGGDAYSYAIVGMHEAIYSDVLRWRIHISVK